MAADAFDQTLTCPFCPFEDVDADFLFQHINVLHPEDQNAAHGLDQARKARVAASSATEGAVGSDWVECSCGEFCLLVEFADHLDLHDAELVEDTESITAGLKPTSSSSASKAGEMSQLASSPNGYSPRHTAISDSPLLYIENGITKDGGPQIPVQNLDSAMRLSNSKPTSSCAPDNTAVNSMRLGVHTPDSIAKRQSNLCSSEQNLAHIMPKSACLHRFER